MTLEEFDKLPLTDNIFKIDEGEHDLFWGAAGAGCIFIALNTGRILLAFRSAYVNEPHEWGSWGGKLDYDETPKEAVEREVKEESGYDGEFRLIPLYIFKEGDFKYHNFLAVVSKEFKPKLDWETEDYEWVEFGDWPSPLHFGLEKLLINSGDKIKRIVDKVKEKKTSGIAEDISNEQALTEAYEDWQGKWVHYSDTPFLKINPKQCHGDISGIYLFPEKFEPTEWWKEKMYKFLVEVPNNLKVLDLAKLTAKQCIDILHKLGADQFPDYTPYYDYIVHAGSKENYYKTPTDPFWELLGRVYMIKPAKWNADFRKLGYDAVFDDTKSIHTKEHQLIVLDPRKIKIVDVIKRSGSGYNDVLKVMSHILQMAKKYKGYVKVEQPKRNKKGGWYSNDMEGHITLSTLPYEQQDDDAYRVITFNVYPHKQENQKTPPHSVSVYVRSTPSRSYGVGAKYSTFTNDWEDVDKLDKEIKWVMTNPKKYVDRW